MYKVIDKNKIRRKVHRRVRRKLAGTSARPRLTVFRSLKHIYAQAIDDVTGCTLVAASSKEAPGGGDGGGNIRAAKQVGGLIAERLLGKGHETVVFDRSGYIYRGRVKALADAAREKGLKF